MPEFVRRDVKQLIGPVCRRYRPFRRADRRDQGFLQGVCRVYPWSGRAFRAPVRDGCQLPVAPSKLSARDIRPAQACSVERPGGTRVTLRRATSEILEGCIR